MSSGGPSTTPPATPPAGLRLLATPSAAALSDLMATFEDLQTVLGCCEKLVTELVGDGAERDGAEGDSNERHGVVVEAVWTMALLSYARCFSASEAGAALTEDDVTSALSNADVLEWHRILLRLRDHYADPATNPRERFSVGVAQDPTGAASGVAVTSARQPLVDDLTVRQTGAIAFALSGLVNDRITAQQELIFGEVKQSTKAELDELAPLDVAKTD